MGLSSKQVSSDRHGWSQALLQGNTLELPKPPSLKRQASQVQQQQSQHQVEQLKCPRCESSNTKFCYYNNYNKSQPRHFCKACKRHWTKGGTLRNVPVGGGRKNKRLKTSTPTNISSKAAASKTNNLTTTNSSNNIKLLLQAQQHHHNQRFNLPLGVASASSLVTYDDKNNNNNNNNFSEAFYQALVRQTPSSLVDTSSITFNNNKSLNDGVFMGATNLTDHHLQFPYSNLGNFDNNNPCSNSSSNFYNFTGENINQQSNNIIEEQVINNTNNNNNTSLSSGSLSDHQQQQQQWKISSTTTANDVIDISSNWGWEDFDKFVTVDADLTMPWDDTEIK